MKEVNVLGEDLIKRTRYPNTVQSIAEELRALGLKKDAVVLVHSSLSKVGWVNGGAPAFVDALMTVIDPEVGTLVMPAQPGDWSEPSNWQNPPVPESWWEIIRETMPAFDPAKTPCPSMGVVADLFRTYPDVKRSNHPAVSFSAWGKEASELTANHSLDFGLGEQSPLKKLYDKEALILAVGTEYDTSTAMHLGEYRAPNPPITEEGAPIIENGRRVWKTYTDIELDEDQFVAIGKQLADKGLVTQGLIGNAQTKLYSVRDAVDESEQYFTEFRS